MQPGRNPPDQRTLEGAVSRVVGSDRHHDQDVRPPHAAPGGRPVASTAEPAPSQPARRSVLKAIGLAGATAAVAGTGALSYRVFDSAALAPGGGRAYDPWRSWVTGTGPLGAVACAVLAANPHNTQPWVFHVTDTAMELFADSQRTIGTVDPLLREQHIGLGCALENLVLGCRARGLEPSVALLPDGGAGGRVAHVSLTPGATTTGPAYEAIGRRHTNRGPYAATGLPDQVLAALVDTSDLPGVAVHWVTAPAEMAVLGRLMGDAALALTQDEQQSQDSFAWFTGSNDEIQQRRDGMTLDAQGLSPLILSLGKLLPASSRTAGDAFWVDQTLTVQTRTAAAYGVVTAADGHDRTSQLAAGRLLQRVHLTATARGIALQPMNQVTERIDRESTTGAAATFGPRLARLLPAGAQPLVAFRVGYPLREALPSPRRTIAAVTR